MPLSGCERRREVGKVGKKKPTKPVKKKEEPCPCPPCPKYESIDLSIDIEKYNCAGLAHRTYTYIGDINDVKAMLGGEKNKIKCSERCDRCKIKHWLWEYDIELYDYKGNKLYGPSKDFHTVAGRCDKYGNDPTNVYSKNGKRPLQGPGTGPAFKPATKEQATTNDRHARPITDSKGRPIYKVRSNFKETCYCLECP